MRIENIFKSYLNNQWLLYREQTLFNMTNILHALMLNQHIIDERILITPRNRSLKDYVKSLITFLIFKGRWHIPRGYTWSSNINESIVELIIN